jgi:hypothetical protein
MGMDLRQKIKSGRARQRKKQAHRREVFNTVSFIVRAYGLDDNFLELLDNTSDYHPQMKMEFTEVKIKKVLELPPFSLVSQEEYRLSMTIADRLDNPYLPFAHSPEEILLSAPLYEANPSLRSEDLLRYDFETLLLYQSAREELAGLEERIKHLQTFIARLESTESQPE